MMPSDYTTEKVTEAIGDYLMAGGRPKDLIRITAQAIEDALTVLKQRWTSDLEEMRP